MAWRICRVGQNRIYTPYMAVYLVISLPKMPYINRIYMVLANPTYMGVLTWCVDLQWYVAVLASELDVSPPLYSVPSLHKQ